jgi:murein DD-endopeptidase MepM/ murein hydrolase activator NlpD
MIILTLYIFILSLLMVFNRLGRHIRMHHHRITTHPHYELIAGHAIELSLVLIAFFLMIGFGAIKPLPHNDYFIYPLQEISHPDCKFEDRDTLAGNCIITLPRISDANFDSYEDDLLRRGVYSVLRSASYDGQRDMGNGGHSGVDIRSSRGTPVVSIGKGEVVEAGRNIGYGNVVKIKYKTPDADIIYAIYAHLDTIMTEAGTRVEAGDRVGTIGNTGISFGDHLHYEIDTTTRRGRPLYPYLDCPETNPYIQNNTDVCIDLLQEHTVDPIAFHETYRGGDNFTPVIDETIVTENQDLDDMNNIPDEDIVVVDETLVASIEPVIDTNDTQLSDIYTIIADNIPDLDISMLSDSAQQFLNTYTIEISHDLSPQTTRNNDANATITITHKITDEPLDGPLPITFSMVPVNNVVRTLPSELDSISDGLALIRLRGMDSGTSIVAITIEDVIIYALPVRVS